MTMGRIRFAALVSVALATFACTPQEHQVVQNFFTAVQAGDESAVSRVSLVSFPGSVTSWEIVEIGPESVEPFTLLDLREDLKEAERALEKHKSQGDIFLQTHTAEAEEYQRRLARNPDYKFTGELLAFKEEWEKQLQTHEELTATVEAARQKIIDLRSAAGLSLNTSVSDSFDGDVRAKLVQLKVVEEGEEKSYTLKLQRYELSDKERNITPMARWIITAVGDGTELSTAEMR
jgi:hypothetical protein